MAHNFSITKKFPPKIHEAESVKQDNFQFYRIVLVREASYKGYSTTCINLQGRGQIGNHVPYRGTLFVPYKRPL